MTGFIAVFISSSYLQQNYLPKITEHEAYRCSEFLMVAPIPVCQRLSRESGLRVTALIMGLLEHQVADIRCKPSAPGGGLLFPGQPIKPALR